MKPQPNSDESGFKGLSDEELKSVANDARYSLVESEIRLRFSHHSLAIAEEELEYRKTAKPKRPPEQWEREWFESVRKIAEAHGLDINVAWQIAKTVVAKADREIS
jgi:hypothetical protein